MVKARASFRDLGKRALLLAEASRRSRWAMRRVHALSYCLKT